MLRTLAHPTQPGTKCSNQKIQEAHRLFRFYAGVGAMREETIRKFGTRKSMHNEVVFGTIRQSDLQSKGKELQYPGICTFDSARTAMNAAITP
jgi:hypothetical protein